MPRRPGGGQSAPDSIEAGLRDLVLDAGPDVRRLSRRETPGLRALMAAAQAPPGWRADVAAAAVIRVLESCVGDIANAGWREAAEAAFRIPAERYVDDEHGRSLAARWKRLALVRGEDPVKRPEAYREYWIRCAPKLATSVEARFEQMRARPVEWDLYRQMQPAPPVRIHPFSFDKTDVLYSFSGRRGVRALTYRWLTAHGPVDHYDAVGWYYEEPDAPVEIVPLANCELGATWDEPLGGRGACLEFSRELQEGERYFFAYATEYHATQACRPAILWEARGMVMDILMLRVQFDRAALPTRLWRVEDEPVEAFDAASVPVAGSETELAVSPNGFVQYEFGHCKAHHRYGIRWDWR